MRLRLPELQDKDEEAKILKAANLVEDWEDIEEVLQYRGLSYVLEIVRSEVINCHYNNLLAKYFGIDKTRELIGRKYYWPRLKKDVKSYVR